MSIRPTIVIVALLLVASLAINWRYVGRVTDGCSRIDRSARVPVTVEAGSVSVRITAAAAAPMATPTVAAAVTAAAAAAPPPRARARASLSPIGDTEDSRFVIVTFATHGVLDFALNWVLHIRALQLPHLVGAMDDALVDACARWRIPAHAVHRDNPEGEHSREAMSGVRGAGMANLRGSDKGFAGLGVLKTLFIQRLLRDGRDVLISDTDTAWFKDPRPLVYGREPRWADFARADLLISTDCIDATDDESERNSGCWYTPVQKNTGMMFFRASNRSLTFVREWEERLVTYTTCPPSAGAPGGRCEGYNDQNLLNEMLEGRRLGAHSWHAADANRAYDRLLRAECAAAYVDGRYGAPLDAGHTPGSRRVFVVCLPGKYARLVVGVLPTIEFANGHSFFVQQRFRSTGVWPTAVHVTFTWGDSAEYAYGKLQRMRDFGLWKLGAINRHATAAAGAQSGGGGGARGAAGASAGEAGAGEAGAGEAGAGSEAEALRRMADRRYLLVSPDGAVPAAAPHVVADYDRRAWQHVAWQLRTRNRLQHALALALALNRTLILPPFHCYCDRYFYRLDGCMIPGGHHATRLPFVCPFDHIFDSSHWYELGRLRRTPTVGRFEALGFEGHLYADELRRAPQIAHSRATLRAASAGGAPAAAPPADAALSATVPRGSRDVDVRASLASLQHARLLEVSLDDAEAVFGGFASRREAADFHALVRHLFGIRVAYCQKECRFEATAYESVKLKQRDPCVWLDGTDKLRELPGGLAGPVAARGEAEEPQGQAHGQGLGAAPGAR